LASTKKPAKAKETEDTRETKREAKREVPKPRATRPKLRSSHGAQVPAKKTTRTSATKAAPAAAPKVRTTRAPLPTPKVASDAAPKSKRSRATPPPAQGQGSLASDAAREVAVAIAVAALDKKAHALEILDVAGKVDYADFLVLMSGKSDRQVAALAQGIEEALRKKGKRALSVEGLPHAIWVLMDFGDVVVHVFQEDSRQLYDLDGLWMDAKRIPLPADA
jgi:ribosome-associated protein